MTMDMQTLYLVVPLAPLLGAIAAGLFGKLIGRTGAHVVAIAGVAASLIASVLVFQDVLAGHTYNGTVYTWMVLGDLRFEVGFLIDSLTAMMMLVVTFVSLMGHVYTIGYMLGLGLGLAYFGSLDYATVFARAPSLASETITLWPGTPWMLMTVIGILLFIGAMGKSAEFPLHVWLPGSMEGPTPVYP